MKPHKHHDYTTRTQEMYFQIIRSEGEQSPSFYLEEHLLADVR